MTVCMCVCMCVSVCMCLCAGVSGSACQNAACSFGCTPTQTGPVCECPQGFQRIGQGLVTRRGHSVCLFLLCARLCVSISDVCLQRQLWKTVCIMIYFTGPTLGSWLVGWLVWCLCCHIPGGLLSFTQLSAVVINYCSDNVDAAINL